MHYHIKKDETWYVNSDNFIYRWIDIEHGTEHERMLTKRDVVRQHPGMPHQLVTTSHNSTIFEVSTQYFDNDSFRIRKGD